MRLDRIPGLTCTQRISQTTSRRVFVFALVATLCIGLGAAEAADALWVEETWQLSTGEPDPDSSAPQVTMVMSPHINTDHEYFVFTLNHHIYPHFVPGGMQIQHWVGEEACAVIGPKEGCLNTNYETVTWTQRLSVENGTLSFEIKDGTSSTWGSFGGNGQFKKSVSTSLTTLNTYQAGISITESGVNFAGNRVSSLVLTRLRWGLSDGSVYEMTAPIDVDRDLLDP